MQNYVRVNLALPKELADWVKKQAKAENRSINNWFQTLLLEKYREKEKVQCTSRR